MFDFEVIEVDIDLLLFNVVKVKSGNSGSCFVVLSDSCGCYVKLMLFCGLVCCIVVDVILRVVVLY